MTATLKLYDPTGVPLPAALQVERTLTALSGKVVGFIDNSKPNFNYLVEDLSELLVSRHGVASVVKRRKRSASQGLDEAVMNELVEQCDAVITGSGD